jgi:hypothetical protein
MSYLQQIATAAWMSKRALVHVDHPFFKHLAGFSKHSPKGGEKAVEGDCGEL